MNIYEQSELMAMIRIQQMQGRTPTGLFTDIDHTYWKQGEEQSMTELTTWLRDQAIPSIAITGNGFKSVIKRIRQGELPQFQAISSSVGTELHILSHEQQYQKDEDYEARLIETGFDRTSLVKRGLHMIDEVAHSHPLWHLTFQQLDKERALIHYPDPHYQKFKVSFYFFAMPDDVSDVVALVQNYFPNQRIVVCEEIGYNSRLSRSDMLRKYCLDILPVTKAEVVQYLASKLGLKRGIVAGDSGNDVDMLIHAPAGFTSVLVGGAQSEALRTLKAHVKLQPRHHSLWSIGGDSKYFYIEEDNRIGPKSILHVFRLLEQRI